MAKPINWYCLAGSFADISNPSTLTFCPSDDGYIRAVQITLFNAITVADSIVSVKVDNVALTPTLTIAFTGSAKGTTFRMELYAAVKRGSIIEIITDGASSTTAIAPCTLEFSA